MGACSCSRSSSSPWAEAKREWGLAFKLGAVAGLTSTLASTAGWLIASGSGAPHAGDAFLSTAVVTGVVTVVFIVAGVLIDRWGHEEISPSPPAPEESSDET